MAMAANLRVDVTNYLIMNQHTDAYTINEGTVSRHPRHSVVADMGFMGTLDSLELKDYTNNNKPTVKAKITGQQFDKFLDFFEGELSFAASNYRDVKKLPLWRSTYGVTDILWEVWHKQHGKMGQSEPVTFCRVCGLLLPLKVLTVDHHKAQAAESSVPIVRVFRGLGLTSGGPKTFQVTGKNKKAVDAHAASVGGRTALPGGIGERTTLNEAGIIYFSVFKAAKLEAALGEKCLHHYLNLRPVCGPCNSQLGKTNVW